MNPNKNYQSFEVSNGLVGLLNDEHAVKYVKRIASSQTMKCHVERDTVRLKEASPFNWTELSKWKSVDFRKH